MMIEKGNYKGHVALLIAYTIFGLSAPIGKLAMSPQGIDAFSLTFFRMAGACVLFWLASLFTVREKVPRKDLMLLLGASLFGIVFNQLPYIVGLSKTSPIDASLVVTLGPIITMIVSAIYLKEPITPKKIFGVLVGAFGALILIVTGVHAATGESHLLGNLLCLLASFSFSLYLTVFRDLIRRYSPITIMKWMFLYAAVICTPICYKNVTTVNYAALGADIYWEIAFVVIGATFVSYLLLPIGQKVLRPTTVSMYNYIQPVVSASVAVYMGLDTFGWEKSLATLLVFLGVYIVTQSKSRAQMDAEKRVIGEVTGDE